MGNSAGTAATVFAAASRGCAALWTGLVAAVAKVLAVQYAVAFLAERNAVGNVKAEFRMVGPRLDMVSVDVVSARASLASVAIAGKHRFTPYLQLRGKAGTITLQRAAILIGIAPSAAPSARARAEYLAALVGVKGRMADWAYAMARTVAALPAILRAIVGAACSVCLNVKVLAAEPTNRLMTYPPRFTAMGIKASVGAKNLCLVERVKRLAAMLADVCALQSYAHKRIISYQALNSKYVAVTLERLSGMGLEPRLADA